MPHSTIKVSFIYIFDDLDIVQSIYKSNVSAWKMLFFQFDQVNVVVLDNNIYLKENSCKMHLKLHFRVLHLTETFLW